MTKYCGRLFTASEINIIRNLISSNPSANRLKLSQMLCRELNWYQPNGGLKEMSCRVAMLRMDKEKLITLPPPLTKNGNGKSNVKRTSEGSPVKEPIKICPQEFKNLKITLVSITKESFLWNELIDRYHYLGYKPLPGAQLRYFVKHNNKVFALLGYGSSAWMTAPRDNYIGWTQEQRKEKKIVTIQAQIA